MGESVAEATIIKWLKNEGDKIAMDEPVMEIATDKVDSEIPSTTEGILIKRLYKEGDVVQVGKAVAIISSNGDSSAPNADSSAANGNISTTTDASGQQENKTSRANQTRASLNPTPFSESKTTSESEILHYTTKENQSSNLKMSQVPRVSASGKFYSPLVRSIAAREGITPAELETLHGTGNAGRITKDDLLAYLPNRSRQQSSRHSSNPIEQQGQGTQQTQQGQQTQNIHQRPAISVGSRDEIIEMDRMRKLIADHMVMSKHVSPHVTSFVEADVTNIVNWRNKTKATFEKREGEKLTFTPIFIEALVKAIRDFPMINVSVDGTKIILRKNINIGMAAALPSGNLIVPVIKNADQLNLVGLVRTVNDLTNRARNNKLLPDDIQGGTYTISNVGTFGNVMGTPIINQPQAAIMAVGAIRKKPAVIETPQGDTIGIRHMMYLSHSYDHRVIDGALGGSFVRRFADYLEQFEPNRVI